MNTKSLISRTLNELACNKMCTVTYFTVLISFLCLMVFMPTRDNPDLTTRIITGIFMGNVIAVILTSIVALFVRPIALYVIDWCIKNFKGRADRGPFLFMMILLVTKYGECSVELFEKDDTDEVMGERHF
jgi:hypothetical protein